jgi:hypothetical protein
LHRGTALLRQATTCHDGRAGPLLLVGQSPWPEPWREPMIAGEREPEQIAMPPCESAAPDAAPRT